MDHEAVAAYLSLPISLAALVVAYLAWLQTRRQERLSHPYLVVTPIEAGVVRINLANNEAGKWRIDSIRVLEPRGGKIGLPKEIPEAGGGFSYCRPDLFESASFSPEWLPVDLALSCSRKTVLLASATLKSSPKNRIELRAEVTPTE